MIALLWASGVFLGLVHLGQGLTVVRRIERQSVLVTGGPAFGAMAEAQALMKIRRPVALRQACASGRVTVPLTYGAFRPVIVLPAEADTWPQERLRAALLHETAHVRRGDWPLNMLTRVAHALYWFHPLAWLSARRARAESETAADDLVLAAGMPAQDYARQLLDVALCARRTRDMGAGAVAMALTPKIEGRLRAVLSLGRSRGEVKGRTRAMLITIAVCVLAVGSMVRVAYRATETAGPGDTAAAHVALGKKLQKEGEPRDGIPEFRRAVQLDPNDAEAQKDLAEALYAINWKRVSDATFGDATFIVYAPPPAVMDEAIPHMRRVVALRPNSLAWHCRLAQYLSGRGRHREAAVEYRRSMHLLTPLSHAHFTRNADGSIPGDVHRWHAIWYDGYRNLCDELVQVGQYQEAVVDLRQELRLNPSSADTLLKLGDALNAAGHRAEARTAWQKCLELQTPHRPGRNWWWQSQARKRLGLPDVPLSF